MTRVFKSLIERCLKALAAPVYLAEPVPIRVRRDDERRGRP